MAFAGEGQVQSLRPGERRRRRTGGARPASGRGRSPPRGAVPSATPGARTRSILFALKLGRRRKPEGAGQVAARPPGRTDFAGAAGRPAASH